MLTLKKIVFFKTPHIMGVENFNEGAKYEKLRILIYGEIISFKIIK